MLVTPGPAVVVIPAGLAILATEFSWAKFLLGKFKQKFMQYSKEARAYFRRKKTSSGNSDKPAVKQDDEDIK